MASPEPNLGEKHACPGCFTLFYDLKAAQPACPSCGEPVSRGKEGPAPAPKEPEEASADSPETPNEGEEEEDFEEDGDGDGGEDEGTEALGAVKPAADPTADEEEE